MRNGGVEIVASFGATEREAAIVLTAFDVSLVVSASLAASSAGSQRAMGTRAARYWTSPDFESSCGWSAVFRFVHVIDGAIALKGTPAAVAFQTAPPPSE